MTMQGRIDLRDELARLLQERLVTATDEHWLDILHAAGVPAGPVQDLGAAVAHPLTAERGLIALAEEGPISGLQQVHLPMDRDRSAPRRPAPAVGEHTEQVLREAGVDEQKISRLTEVLHGPGGQARRRGTVQTG